MTILSDLEAGNFKAVWGDVIAGWEGSSLGTVIDAAASAAWAELQAIAPADLLGIVESVGTAILGGVTAGNPTSAIISEGILIAEQAFANVSKQVAATTLSTFVSAVHNQVSVTASTAAAPAPVVDPAPAA